MLTGRGAFQPLCSGTLGWGLCDPRVVSCKPPGATLASLDGRQSLCRVAALSRCTFFSPLLSWSLYSALSFFLRLISLFLSPNLSPFSPLLSPSLSLSFLLGFSFGLCVFPVFFSSPHISHLGKAILCPKYIWFDFEPLPHSSKPSTQPFLLRVPARSPRLFSVPYIPSSPSGLSFLLTDGRAVSTPSLKQHLIAVFCSWTSKLELRRCAGGAVRGL